MGLRDICSVDGVRGWTLPQSRNESWREPLGSPSPFCNFESLRLIVFDNAMSNSVLCEAAFSPKVSQHAPYLTGALWEIKISGENNRNRDWIYSEISHLKSSAKGFSTATLFSKECCMLSIKLVKLQFHKMFHFSRNCIYREIINLRSNVWKDQDTKFSTHKS